MNSEQFTFVNQFCCRILKQCVRRHCRLRKKQQKTVSLLLHISSAEKKSHYLQMTNESDSVNRHFFVSSVRIMIISRRAHQVHSNIAISDLLSVHRNSKRDQFRTVDLLLLSLHEKLRFFFFSLFSFLVSYRSLINAENKQNEKNHVVCVCRMWLK